MTQRYDLLPCKEEELPLVVFGNSPSLLFCVLLLSGTSVDLVHVRILLGKGDGDAG